VGRPVMVGHILRYHPAFEALEQLVREGALGRLLSVTSSRLDLGRIRREEDALWALAPHDLSMVLALLGSEPETIRASAGFHTHPAIADEAIVNLDFADGARAEVRSSWLSPFKEQRLTVVGTRAMAVFDDRETWERKLVLHRYRLEERVDGEPDVSRDEPIPVPIPHGEPLHLECSHFLQCIASGTRPKTDGLEALRVLRVLEKASEAIRTNRTRL
jgi:UDP-2-acetamido-3-amino-2,3-dideoxy-glucuronate N-acetyltransferase